MSAELPDWITVGRHVAEQCRGYTFTTVKRITPTLVVLDNGSRYRRDGLRKVGESGKYVQTWLQRAEDAYAVLIKATVRGVADAAGRASYQVTEHDADAGQALEQIATAVADAQGRVTKLQAARAAIQNPEG